MFYLNWYPFQCCYLPRHYLQYLLHYSLVVAVVVVVVVVVAAAVVVVVVAAAAVVVAVVVVVVVVVAAAAVVDFVWQFYRNQDCSWSDCQSSVVGYSASFVGVF